MNITACEIFLFELFLPDRPYLAEYKKQYKHHRAACYSGIGKIENPFPQIRKHTEVKEICNHIDAVCVCVEKAFVHIAYAAAYYQTYAYGIRYCESGAIKHRKHDYSYDSNGRQYHKNRTCIGETAHCRSGIFDIFQSENPWYYINSAAVDEKFTALYQMFRQQVEEDHCRGDRIKYRQYHGTPPAAFVFKWVKP